MTVSAKRKKTKFTQDLLEKANPENCIIKKHKIALKRFAEVILEENFIRIEKYVSQHTYKIFNNECFQNISSPFKREIRLRQHSIAASA